MDGSKLAQNTQKKTKHAGLTTTHTHTHTHTQYIHTHTRVINHQRGTSNYWSRRLAQNSGFYT